MGETNLQPLSRLLVVSSMRCVLCCAGQGAFGKVFEAKIRVREEKAKAKGLKYNAHASGTGNVDVALKLMKKGSSKEDELMFAHEAVVTNQVW